MNNYHARLTYSAYRHFGVRINLRKSAQSADYKNVVCFNASFKNSTTFADFRIGMLMREPVSSSKTNNALIFMTNEEYGNGFLVTLASALVTSNLDDFNIYVGYSSDEPIDEIWEAAIALCHRFEFPVERCHRIEVDLNIFEQYEAFHNGAYHPYGRFYLISILEEPTLLYLDSDMLALDDLSKLVQLVPRNAPIAAVQARSRPTHMHDTYILDGKPSTNDTSPYFNSGLLLINNSKYREFEVFRQLSDLYPRLTNVELHDQTYLNVMFKDQWQRLPFYWNVYTTASCPLPMIIEDEEPVRIFHFLSFEKPWRNPSMNIPYILWYILARNIGVRIDPAVNEVYLELARSFEFDEYVRKQSELIHEDFDATPVSEIYREPLIQNLNNYGAELSIIQNWLEKHNLGPIPEPFSNLLHLAKSPTVPTSYQ